MNHYEQAIAEIKHRAAHPMKIVLTEETARLAVEALGKQAEGEKMRCENCMHYIEDYFPMNPTDFCSNFEPKEKKHD